MFKIMLDVFIELIKLNKTSMQLHSLFFLINRLIVFKTISPILYKKDF